jgi:hypothetical protein
MSHFELIRLILKRKFWFILVFFLTASIVAFIELKKPEEYKSSVKFFVEDEELYTTELNVMKSPSQNRIFYFIKSTEMFDYLIKKFNLYSNYNIDTTTLLHYENIDAILNEKIEAKTDNRNAVVVTVKDRDKFLAAAMANEIFRKVSEMNKEFVISVAKKKISVYEEIISKNKEQMMSQALELDRMIGECKKLIYENTILQKNYTFVSELRLHLTTLSNQLQSVNDELLKTVKIYNISVAGTQKENISSLRLINVALPDIRNPINVSIIRIIIWAISMVLISIFTYIMYFEYRSYFALVPNRQQAEI